MIGSWDESNCEFALAFNAWSKGNGTSNQNTGEMPGYPNGNEDATFTNMGSGYGYVYNSGNGYCNFDGTNDHLTTLNDLSLSNGSNHTIEAKIKYNANIDYICEWYIDANNRLRFGVYADKLDGFAKINGKAFHLKSADTLIDGQEYTLHMRKTGSVRQFFINGTEVSGYDLQYTYNGGNATLTDMTLGWSPSRVAYANGEMYWFAVYSHAMSNADILNNHNLGNDMGLVGNNTGDVMALTAPGGVPPIMNHYKRLRAA